MILLLGASTYVGRAFARALGRRKDSFIPLSRNAFDYTRFESLFDYVRKVKPELVINAADHPEKPDCDGETDRSTMLQVNTLLPQTIARVCSLTNTDFGHVSSGSIYSGAKLARNGQVRIEEDLGSAPIRTLFELDPKQLAGFTEEDQPNFCFSSPGSTFYSGTKALAEEALRQGQAYIWRLRLPFNEQDDPGNFLSQLQDGWKAHDAINSLSHLDECVAACLELWERHAAVGIYNVTNPGPLRTRQIIQLLQQHLKPVRPLELLVYRDEPTNGDRPPRSDCVLDSSKLLRAGVRLRSAQQALEHSLEKWVPQPVPALKTLA